MATKFIAFDKGGDCLSIANITDETQRVEIPAGVSTVEIQRLFYSVKKDGSEIVLFGAPTVASIYNLENPGEKTIEVKLPYMEFYESLYLTLAGQLLALTHSRKIYSINRYTKKTSVMIECDTGHYIICSGVTCTEEALFILITDHSRNDYPSYYINRVNIADQKTDVRQLGEEAVVSVMCSTVNSDIIFVLYHEEVSVLDFETTSHLATLKFPKGLVAPEQNIKTSYSDQQLFVNLNEQGDSTEKDGIYMYTKQESSYDYELTRIFTVNAIPSLRLFTISLPGSEMMTISEKGKLNIWDTSSGEKILTTTRTPGKVAFLPNFRSRVKPAKVDRGQQEEEEEEEDGDNNISKKQKTNTCLKCLHTV